MDFAAKRAVVTGAASGIGEAIAAELAARGARVLLADIDEAGLEASAAAIGDAAAWQRCDVSDHAQVEALAATARERMGGCDFVFANAGVITTGRMVKMKPADVDWILGVNVRGAWSTAAVFARMMQDQPDGGHVVFTGSEHSLGFQHAGAAIYTASKHAVLGLAEVLRAEAPANLKVSVFCPGLVATALGGSPRPERSAHPSPQSEASRMVQARGMTAREAAQRALDGVAEGAFYIVTHPHSLRAAETRFHEVEQAFAAQAPWFEGAEKWDVNVVMAEVAAELKKR
ncbi:MAG: SDR family NAD(P)-dependent oxidoreductase [Novosphingobium sp.]|nr:SDR family NAD(P)-dependent oxidoreductase [Novosphingobium sp.]